ncbi:DUF1294 domain-containing protein [Virgibacillus flavescens]|uniref:DUF1294 domain-containing protein n=1 Tax=Virgibacillus flavescens TaxID=1611422 RepID=UPI003D352238
MNIQIVMIVLLAINLFTFFLIGVDKNRARKQRWRISEKTLWLSAICGGSIGTISGMYFFRHKTKHRLFTIGMPVILLIQVTSVIIAFSMS